MSSRPQRPIVFLAVVVMVGVAVPLLAQADPPGSPDNPRRVEHDRTGKLTFVGIDAHLGDFPGVAQDVLTNITPEVGLEAITAYAAEFGLTDPNRELEFVGIRGGSRGRPSALHYQQVHEGIPVVGGELVVSYDAAGRLAAITGEISPMVSVSTAPGISQIEAVELATAYVARATGIPSQRLVASPAELWIHDSRLLGPSERPVELVWRMEVESTGLEPVRFLVLVNAEWGGVGVAFNQIDTSWTGRVESASEKSFAGSVGRPASTADSTFESLFPTPNMFTYDSHHSDARQGGVDSDTGAISSTLTCSIPPGTDPPALTGVNSCDGTGTASAANAAHFFAYDTFAYFDANHGRNSIDNAGMALISNVDYTPIPPYPNPGSYFNAFWDGTQMTYGNAGFWTADDVVGHELTHGVTGFSSSLFYYYESGAINEAMSDVFGEFVDLANGIDSFGSAEAPGDRWLVGEDLTIGAIRDMSNPPAFSDPDRMQSPLYYAPGGVWYGVNGDNGGVHINSGVANKAAYLLVDGDTFNSQTVTPIGMAKTSAIFYETNNTLLTTGSDYGVLGAALVQGCNNLVGGAEGITAADCTQVGNATTATEMHLEPSTAGYSPDAAYECPDSADTPVDLFFDDMTSPTLVPTGPTWFVASFYAYSPGTSIWARDNVITLDGNARTASGVALTGYDSYFLHFQHAFGFEDYLLGGDPNAYDGGVLEYSTAGAGGPWMDITSGGPAFVDGLAYNSTIAAGFSNPIEGRSAFGYDSHGWVSSRYDLTTLAGSTVDVRFRIGTDNFQAPDLGWFIDDVRIYGCGAAGACPYSTTLDLANETVTTTETRGACDTVTVGPNFAVNSPGDLTIEAGNRVILKDGTSVGAGAGLTIVIDPGLSP
jgi:Zn-dependent metalloprotease